MAVPELRRATLVTRDADDRPSLVDPTSGEVYPLNELSDDALAGLVVKLRELRSELNEALDAVGEVVMGRMDRSASWTMNAGGTTLRAPSPAGKVAYDAEALLKDLRKLVRKGVIDAKAIEEAIKTVPRSYETKHAGIQKLLKLGGEVAETVHRHGKPVAEKRRLSVSNAPRL